ncbi:type VI secretion system accessory protein TagJ [Variovorax dokdonensis]|uniref:Type VI secretion system accessory protein TagJ n=1 Tax=Variovorax dokdonensis TaxID=344883 RepID=A0ABT7N8F0_9BURK|nr:type VI secretion system accessory protein TagJ [Variovorax dokdonensis]MDM0044212.1 type VI secretion system accessory protein TagJ [Variovorax dokdonensis]
MEIWAKLENASKDTLRIFRNLIQGEIQREKILSGLAAPSICGAPNGLTAIWMLKLAQAMRAVAHAGNDPLAAIAAGDAMRRAALAEAPQSSGTANGSLNFQWLTDSDTRLGPVCEMTLAEGYRWLAFGNICRIDRGTSGGLLDLIWAPAQIELRHGETIAGHLPMRYPLKKDDRDELLMCRETAWTTLGETGILGHGQKVWRTDQGNLALHDLRTCVFN